MLSEEDCRKLIEGRPEVVIADSIFDFECPIVGTGGTGQAEIPLVSDPEAVPVPNTIAEALYIEAKRLCDNKDYSAAASSSSTTPTYTVLKAAGMGKGDTKWTGVSARGDWTTVGWLE
jgi:hypothetical protein